MTPRPLTAAELADLRELLEKATEAPWFVVGPPWNRGEPFINARTEDPHGGQPVCDFAIQAENDDGGPQSDPHPIEDAVLVCALRNHAESLLDAAEENARLKAGVSDRDHTTHFDDCGCRSARYEADIARLKAKIAAVEPVARAAVRLRDMQIACGDDPHEWIRRGGDDTNLAWQDAVDALPVAVRKEYEA